MATTDEEFPHVNADPYELRFTWRALVDIDVHRETPAGSLRTIMAASPWPDIVAEFIDQRALSPHTTGGHLARCGRGDIAELHSTSGGRAGTWYDKQKEVVWFLWFSSQHDYAQLKARARAGELMPSEDDREERDFRDRVGHDLDELIRSACESPDVPVKGRVGRLLRREVTAIVVSIDEKTIGDLYVLIRVPPLEQGDPPAPGWPAEHLQERIAEMACDSGAEWDAPTAVPDGSGSFRDVDYTKELPILVRSCDLSEYVI